VLDLLSESFYATGGVLSLVIVALLVSFTAAIEILFCDLVEHANLAVELLDGGLVGSLVVLPLLFRLLGVHVVITLAVREV